MGAPTKTYAGKSLQGVRWKMGAVFTHVFYTFFEIAKN
jgi:hypothetical protein